MKSSLIALFGGVMFLLFGLVLANPVISFAVTAGTTTGVGSFGGVASLNNLVPFVYYVIILVGGLGMISAGGMGLAGRGPLSR